MSKPLIIAHRGASYDAPENTLIAFEQAIAEGADGIEFDVRLAGDGVPVCIHDLTLRRTGLRDGHINRLSADELASVDVGTWFNLRFPKRARAEFAEARIPTLAEALRCFREKSQGEFHVYVEMKCRKGEEETLARAVADVVRAEEAGLRVVVASFTLAAIREIKSLDASINTAALFETGAFDPRPDTAKLIARATEIGAGALMLHRTLVNRRSVKLIREHNLPLTIWTVDDKRSMQRAIDYDLYSVITNRPAAMMAWRDESIALASSSTL
jgi:glycerophosphoryl diester phosphodiesterase